MGSPDRSEADAVIDAIVADPSGYQFFQVVRVIRRAFDVADQEQGDASPLGGRIRFRATPTLGFPATDVTGATRREVDEAGTPGVELEVPFLGLYGPASPLPPFVTETVIARDRDTDTLRDFLDLFNHRAVEILYMIWRKYRHWVLYRTGATDRISGYVIALMGLLGLRSGASTLSLESLLPFAGNLGLAGHSAQLLEVLVSSQFPGVRTRVEEFVPRLARVLPEQQGRLGVRNTELGGDWVLGELVPDISGKFRLWMGPLGIEEYRSFIPGRGNRRRLADLVNATIRTRLEYEVVFVIRRDEIPSWRLGDTGALGHDTWLSDEGDAETVIASAA